MENQEKTWQEEEMNLEIHLDSDSDDNSIGILSDLSQEEFDNLFNV